MRTTPPRDAGSNAGRVSPLVVANHGCHAPWWWNTVPSNGWRAVGPARRTRVPSATPASTTSSGHRSAGRSRTTWVRYPPGAGSAALLDDEHVAAPVVLELGDGEARVVAGLLHRSPVVRADALPQFLAVGHGHLRRRVRPVEVQDR